MVRDINVGECGTIYLCMLWKGVYLWANVISGKHLTYQQPEGRHITINYCISGRCELCLRDDTYLYMEPGMLCIDSNGPRDGFYYPTGSYTGLEFYFVLDELENEPAHGLTDYGDFTGRMEQLLNANNGDYLASMNDRCREEAKALFGDLTDQKLNDEDCRYRAMVLLYQLFHGGMTHIARMEYVTKGQRRIAESAEKRITEDLSRRITIESMAADFGVSPSALKKYFEKVYGQPVSVYILNLRISRAKKLLAETRMKVGEVAEECGYHHQGKFGEVFKEQTGVSPLEYRRRNYSSVSEH